LSFYSGFYKDSKKVVPLSLSLLTPLALAHWIMQDGSYHKNVGGIRPTPWGHFALTPLNPPMFKD